LAEQYSDFPLEYVSGAIELPGRGATLGSQIVVTVVNTGDEDGSFRCLAFREHGQELPEVMPEFDSGVLTVHAQRARDTTFTIPAEQSGFVPDTFWVAVKLDSSSLVPSIEYFNQDVEGPGRVHLASCQPNDFAVFHRRVRILPVPPIGPPIE
jgi:hypothetical protein